MTREEIEGWQRLCRDSAGGVHIDKRALGELVEDALALLDERAAHARLRARIEAKAMQAEQAASRARGVDKLHLRRVADELRALLTEPTTTEGEHDGG